MATNIIDIIFFIIITASGILAFQNGFVKEVMRILSWVMAILTALYTYPLAIPLIEKFIQNETLINIVAGSSMFLFFIIIFYIISHYINDIVKNTPVGALNKSLGFLFGMVRGVMVMAFLYTTFGYITDKKMPTFVLQAKTEPIIRSTAKIGITIFPKALKLNVGGMLNTLTDIAEDTQDIQGTFEKLNLPPLEMQ